MGLWWLLNFASGRAILAWWANSSSTSAKPNKPATQEGGRGAHAQTAPHTCRVPWRGHLPTRDTRVCLRTLLPASFHWLLPPSRAHPSRKASEGSALLTRCCPVYRPLLFSRPLLTLFLTTPCSRLPSLLFFSRPPARLPLLQLHCASPHRGSCAEQRVGIPALPATHQLLNMGHVSSPVRTLESSTKKWGLWPCPTGLLWGLNEDMRAHACLCGIVFGT